MIKFNYKNVQNKWQENHAKWFIELIKKNSFQEISKDFIKNKFELIISIYLFTKKSQFIFLKWFNSISFVFNFQKSYLHLLYQNDLLQNFNLITKIIFVCFYYKWMNFYNFIYKNVKIQSNFIKKMISTTLICKNNSHLILIKKILFKSSISKNYF